MNRAHCVFSGTAKASLLVALLGCAMAAGCDRASPPVETRASATGAAAPGVPVVAPSVGGASARAVESKQESQAMSQLPDGYKPYATHPIGVDRSCTAGVVTDEDGLQQRPVVAISGANRTVLWARHLEGLEDAYQARATHCAQGDDGLYVLLQSDTHSSPALSQTLLSVVRLNAKGNLTGASDIAVPEGRGRAYSAYVGEVPDDFEWKDGALVVKGLYFFTATPDARMPFAVTLQPEDFVRRQEAVHGQP